MDTPLFTLSLWLAVAAPLLAIHYLRPILERVLRGLCDADSGTEFWIRCATLLAVSGTLLLTPRFGDFSLAAGALDTIRRALWLSLLGMFTTVAIVAFNVSSQIEAWLVEQRFERSAALAAAARPATATTGAAS